MSITEKIYRNVKALSELTGKPMAEVEQQIGKATGYLSRKRTRFDAEILVRLSQIFGVGVEALMGEDYEYQLTEMEAVQAAKDAVWAALKYMEADDLMDILKAIVKGEEPDAAGV